jgi:hypothetical protein
VVAKTTSRAAATTDTAAGNTVGSRDGERLSRAEPGSVERDSLSWVRFLSCRMARTLLTLRRQYHKASVDIRSSYAVFLAQPTVTREAKVKAPGLRLPGAAVIELWLARGQHRMRKSAVRWGRIGGGRAFFRQTRPRVLLKWPTASHTTRLIVAASQTGYRRVLFSLHRLPGSPIPRAQKHASKRSAVRPLNTAGCRPRRGRRC